MLVLTRKVGQKIHVGNDITFEIRRVAGNRVSLAIDAPPNVLIFRDELLAALKAENQGESDDRV